MGLPRVERVVKMLPQEHLTETSLYSGWPWAFMTDSSVMRGFKAATQVSQRDARGGELCQKRGRETKPRWCGVGATGHQFAKTGFSFS